MLFFTHSQIGKEADSLNKKIILAGHRGDRKHAPENTMPSFKQAVSLGVDMIETDIHMSRDGVMYIMHDDTVDRTTDGTGLGREKTWAEICELDAGSWFSDAFKGVKVPSLDEFLQYVADTPDLLVNWELKDWECDCGREFAFKSADGLLAGIRKYHLEDRSMLNSFSSSVLEYVWKQSKGSMSIHGQGVYPTSKMRDIALYAPKTYWDWACMYGPSGTPKRLPEKVSYDNCIAQGIIPCVCIPDTLENYRQAIEFGCRMFTSDDPEQGIKNLRELGERE